MSELTESFKYVFLDVVKFTKRTVEAQTDVINELNKIVNNATANIQRYQRIYIPTGDGICIAIKNVPSYDIHIQIALDILAKIHEYNETQINEARKFEVRIGINENVDNIIEDINENTNVAGAGINLASRIMDNAEESQILISQTVYDILHVREKYAGFFKSYSATIKHGISLPVYQYVKEGLKGLNIKVPSNFSINKIYTLSKKSAYYFAHALKNRELLITKTKKEASDYAAVILLWYLAEDSYQMSICKDFDSAIIKQPGEGKYSVEKQYDAIQSSIFWIISDLCEFIVGSHLKKFHNDSFEVDQYGCKCWFIINNHGQLKLRKEHPEIWQEFNLDEYVK